MDRAADANPRLAVSAAKKAVIIKKDLFVPKRPAAYFHRE